jgi:hypothetical protein
MRQLWLLAFASIAFGSITPVLTRLPYCLRCLRLPACLFDQPYSQAKLSTVREHGGTGLGLSIAKRIVTQMKGRVNHCSSTALLSAALWEPLGAGRLLASLRAQCGLFVPSRPLQHGLSSEGFC